jgi:hypothetical protein
MAAGKPKSSPVIVIVIAIAMQAKSPGFSSRAFVVETLQ